MTALLSLSAPLLGLGGLLLLQRLERVLAPTLGPTGEPLPGRRSGTASGARRP